MHKKNIGPQIQEHDNANGELLLTSSGRVSMPTVRLVPTMNGAPAYGAASTTTSALVKRIDSKKIPMAEEPASTKKLKTSIEDSPKVITHAFNGLLEAIEHVEKPKTTVIDIDDEIAALEQVLQQQKQLLAEKQALRAQNLKQVQNKITDYVNALTCELDILHNLTELQKKLIASSAELDKTRLALNSVATEGEIQEKYSSLLPAGFTDLRAAHKKQKAEYLSAQPAQQITNKLNP